jgi:LacI family transcriptional regulator
MATIRDVAKRAGVAISTVSLALNGTGPVSADTRKRIMDAADAVGYVPNVLAQNLKRGHSRLVGLVLGDIGNPFFGRMLRTVDDLVFKSDHMVIVADTGFHFDREIITLEQLKRQRVAGILMAPLGNDPQFASYLRQLDIPMVLIDQHVEGSRLDFVSSDNVLATKMLTDYLIRLGHRRICYLGGQKRLWTANLRLQGYREAMASAGLEIEPDFEIETDFSGEMAYDCLARVLLPSNRPTAIVAANNLMALGALKAIADLGFDCPGDISLTGIDDVPWSSVIKPRITIVAQPIEDMATVATKWLLERMQTRGGTALPPRTHIAMPKFILGDSCAPPRAG